MLAGRGGLREVGHFELDLVRQESTRIRRNRRFLLIIEAVEYLSIKKGRSPLSLLLLLGEQTKVPTSFIGQDPQRAAIWNRTCRRRGVVQVTNSRRHAIVT